MYQDPNCLFCKIIDGKIPAAKIYEDSRFVCIRDIQPQAKAHFLVLPKHHLASLDAAFPESGDQHNQLIGDLFQVGTRIAREQGLLPGGFRSVINTGENGGQTVFHIHLHILGGERLKGSFGV
jgi:histidine triad (HIT) family protein